MATPTHSIFPWDIGSAGVLDAKKRLSDTMEMNDMGKKKTPEPGLAYTKQIGIKAARDMHHVYTLLGNRFGTKEAQHFLDTLQSYNNILDRSVEYEYKNSDFEKCMIFTGGYDGNIIRKCANWIIQHKEYFGKRILDVGCDCGIMSCFIAQAFPDSQVLSIDRGTNCIAIAQRLAKQLSLTNIEFRSNSPESLDESNFDTVFSMRTMHENYDHSLTEDSLADLCEQSAVFRSSLKPYASALVEKLVPGGHLVSIERTERNSLYLAWLESLDECGMSFDFSCYEALACQELDEVSEFQAFAALKIEEEHASPLDIFYYAYQKYTDVSQAQYFGNEAKVVYQLKRGQLIEGYYLSNKYTSYHGKICLWTHKYDDTGLVRYQNIDGFAQLEFYDISQADEGVESLRTAIDDLKEKMQGVIVTPMQE